MFYFTSPLSLLVLEVGFTLGSSEVSDTSTILGCRLLPWPVLERLCCYSLKLSLFLWTRKESLLLTTSNYLC